MIWIDGSGAVSYPGTAYAYSVDNVVELVQGSSRIPAKLQEQYLRFEDALDQEQLCAARAILQEMIGEYGRENTEVRRAQAELSAEDDAEE